MKHFQCAVVMSIAAILSACDGDDNDDEIRALESDIAELTESLDEVSAANEAEIAALEAEIASLEAALASAEEASDEEIAAMEAEMAALQAELDALTYVAPALGSQATQGANVLAKDSGDQVWRFAIFPDTQGRDDDNMARIANDREGNDLGIEVYHGYDYNDDGVYDADGYRVNVEDPYNPYIETDAQGQPIVVAVEERADFPRDFKIIPQPLVEAVVDKIVELDVDLVLAIGDMTEYRAESDYVMWMNKVAAPLQEADIDIYPLRGNHEIVNGRNWQQWFSYEEEPEERQSVDNVLNGFSAYSQGDTYDQGYKLYQAYVGSLLTENIDSGEVMGLSGVEDLNYYFIHNNTLFIGIDFYFGDLYSSAYKGTWIELAEWLHDTITTHGPSVDHVVIYGHEPLSTKKRPQTYYAEQYEDYLARNLELQTTVDAAEAAVDAAQNDLDEAVGSGAAADEIDALTAELEAAQLALEQANSDLDDSEEPGLVGYDIGQLGYLLLQDQSEPGLAKSLLDLFTEYQVNYIAGHDHQYARSLIHSDAEAKNQGRGFTQMIVGNASWKAYENLYGINDEYETGLFIDNFYNSADLSGDGYNIHDGLGKGISFILVEVNGRQITTTNYFTRHNYTESDMNLGLRYDYDNNCWTTYSGSYRSGTPSTSTCVAAEWVKVDESTRTIDGLQRVVGPYANYWATTATPQEQGYIGSEATVLDGYNLTFDSAYAAEVDRIELMSELLSLSWFVDEDETTLSDVLVISGNQNQDGSHFDEFGDYIDGASPSITYINRNGYEVDNPTHVTRDGVMNKGTDIVASLTGDNSVVEGPGGSRQASWANRYHDDGLDFADALTISFVAPEGTVLTDLTIGRYDEASNSWVPALREDCYVDTGYSEHFSVHYRIDEQQPEGGFAIEGCQQFYWGYHNESNAIWGFIHTDGKFAVIAR